MCLVNIPEHLSHRRQRSEPPSGLATYGCIKGCVAWRQSSDTVWYLILFRHVPVYYIKILLLFLFSSFSFLLLFLFSSSSLLLSSLLLIFFFFFSSLLLLLFFFSSSLLFYYLLFFSSSLILSSLLIFLFFFFSSLLLLFFFSSSPLLFYYLLFFYFFSSSSSFIQQPSMGFRLHQTMPGRSIHHHRCPIFRTQYSNIFQEFLPPSILWASS